MSVAVLQAYRFALDPTRAQARNLERHAARFAYKPLAAVRANIGQRAAERSYGLGGEDLTPVLGWNLPAPRRAWNQVKDQAAPWWTEYSNLGDSQAGKRAGRKVGVPRFQTRRRATPPVRFTTGVIRV